MHVVLARFQQCAIEDVQAKGGRIPAHYQCNQSGMRGNGSACRTYFGRSGCDKGTFAPDADDKTFIHQALHGALGCDTADEQCLCQLGLGRQFAICIYAVENVLLDTTIHLLTQCFMLLQIQPLLLVWIVGGNGAILFCHC